MTGINSFAAAIHMQDYRAIWERRLDALERYLNDGGKRA